MKKQYISEAKLEAKLVEAAKGVGGWAIKLVPTFISGLPDRLCLFPGGVVVFVEMKAPGEKPRDLQTAIHSKLRRLGFRVEVIDSVELINKLINEYK